jgi:hypothetical protein
VNLIKIHSFLVCSHFAVVGKNVSFLLYRKVRPIKQKRFALDAHLADMYLVAAQHRSGAQESQATLYFIGGNYHEYSTSGEFNKNI